MLPSPNLLFDKVASLASRAEENWLRLKIPKAIKAEFASAWEDQIGYRAIPSDGQTKLYTSDTNCENVVDSDLVKAIAAGKYRSELHSLRNAVIELADKNGITTFKDDFKAKVNGLPNSWKKWNEAIEKSAHSEDEKLLLRDFLTNSDNFHGIKGISRDDFTSPAICKAIGKRTDRFSIADQIAMAATESLVDKVSALIEEKSVGVGAPKSELKLALLPRMLHSSPLTLTLITKPFTILTGASGTGKTKLAESLAGHYRNNEDIKKATNVAIVPVGADWTDNRNVLGFVNHLREGKLNADETSRPIYQSTPILDLILNAVADKDTPHFLILDEMNLSHVERYFADFLSAMEQSNGALPLHSEGSEHQNQCCLPRFEGDSIGVPRDISYPDNLYVIGTVNVDETTYMFSPKVLDRANVIEFKVAKDELDEFLDEAGNYPEVVRANEGQAEAFHKLAMESRDGKLDDLPAPVHAEIKAHLLALFDIMQEGRFEFAYRTAKEVMRYMAVCRHLADDKDAWDGKGWKSDLDDQILQKILPKLHGSMGRVGKLLAALAAYCHNGGLTGEAPNLNASIQLEGEGEFPKSFSKLKSMMETLKEEQFVSFIQ